MAFFERSPRSGASVLAWGLAAVLAATGVWTVRDQRRRVAEARQAVGRLAQMQASYHRLHGEYTDNVSNLADMSSDWFAFMDSLAVVLDLRAGFMMEVGERGFRITANARDLRRTPVVVEGPLPPAP